MKSRCLLLLLVLLILLGGLAPAPAWGGETGPLLRFRTIEGLPSPCVRDLLQDETGYIWVATDGGVVRYDGLQMMVLSRSTPAGSILQDSFVSTLCEITYSAGRQIWLGADTGIYVFDPLTEQLQPLPPYVTPRGDSLQLHGLVRDMIFGADGNVWVSVAEEGLYCLTPQRAQITHYPLPQVNNSVSKLFADSNQNIWALGATALLRLNKANGQFEPFAIYAQDTTASFPLRAITEDTQHRFWVGLPESGLLCIDPYTHRATEYLSDLAHVHSLEVYGPNQLLIGSDMGLSYFDTQTGTHRLYREEELDRQSLSNRFVYPILIDREGGLWVGTYIGGLNYAPPPLKQFDGWYHSQYRNSLPGNLVSRLCEDPLTGTIWVATQDGGLAQFNPSTEEFTSVPLQGLGKSANLHALCMDGEDLWIGTYAQGVVVLNTRTGKQRRFTHQSDNSNSLDDNSSYAILCSSDKRLWVATMRGLQEYNRQTKAFQRIKTLDIQILSMVEDTSGTLWMATQGKGIYTYHPQTQQWQNFRHSDAPGALPHNHVQCLYRSPLGTLWIGTENGLCVFDPATQTFIPQPVSLPHPIVCGVTQEQDVLWITTLNGLVRYEPGVGTGVFTTSDGLMGSQFSSNCLIKTSVGQILAGSNRGLNAFYPHKIHPNEYRAPLVFSQLEVDNHLLKPTEEGLPKPLSQLESLTLSHRNHSFTISFALLSYYDPQRNQYAYYLEGYDKQWHYNGPLNRATYTHVPPGTYRLQVKACNNDEVWVSQLLELPIKVLPPWYLTRLMKGFYCLLFLVVITGLILYLLHRKEREHRKELYDAKMKYFTMIAHEIRTPVTLITGPLRQLLEASRPLPLAVRDELQMMDRNANRLLFLVNQLLDFKKVDENAFTINPVPQEVGPIVQAVVERFASSVDRRGINWEITPPGQGLVASIDAEALTKIISNLLNNALKFTHNRIAVEVKRVGEEHFSISVADNGPGISSAHQKKIFTPFYQVVAHEKDSSKGGTGLGLSLVQHLSEAHGGDVKVVSKEGQGATFTVTLPLQYKPQTPSAQAHPQEMASQAPSGAPQKPVLLVVEDNDDLRQFIAQHFSPTYQILTAAEGQEALRLLQEKEVHLILSDWMMPQMDGAALCAAVRNDTRTSHIPFVMLTAKTGDLARTQGMNCGADLYVEKPFSLSYLEACVRNLLEMRRRLMLKYTTSPTEPLTSVSSTPMDEAFLLKLTAQIEQHLSDPHLNVDLLSEQMAMSRSTFYAKIKGLTNVTPNELILIARLKKAAQLLREGTYRIGEVSYMVGFSSPSYFAKCFSKQFGVKPSEWGKPQEPDN